LISIVIPTCSNLDNLRPCIESISQYTDLSKIEVIVVANGCSNEVYSYVNSQGPPFRIISFPNQLGYAKSVNEGIRNSVHDHIILLNDDTILLNQPKNLWIELLKQPFNDPNVGISGPHKLRCPISNFPFLVFFCVMIGRNLKNSIGLLDESYLTGGYEDADYCIRAENAGFKIVKVGEQYDRNLNKIIPIFPIYHRGEATVNNIQDWDKIFESNKKIFFKKYYLNKPLISVVIPCRIGDKLDCIESLQKQTYKNLEFIVINDFNRRGAGYCRNIGIKQARGEFVLFSDTDLIWYNDSIEILYNTLINSKCSYSYGGFSNKGKPVMFMKEFNNIDLLRSNYITVNSLVKKKDIPLFDESLEMFEDWDLWLTMLREGRTGKFCGKEVFYTYDRVGTSSRSDSDYWLNKVQSKYRGKL